MMRNLLDIITGRSERRSRIQRVTRTEPLQRFSDAESFGHFPFFKPIARALARQTNDMVESLLSDEAIPDWTSLGECATPQQLMDLSIFCSHCLVQSTIQGVKAPSALARLHAGLRSDLSHLVYRMYGNFATTSPLGAITFDESLQMRNLDDDFEIRDLTRLLDRLMGLENGNDPHREVKIQKLRAIFTVHQRAFAYRLHGIL